MPASNRPAAASGRRRAAGWRSGSSRLANSGRTPTCCPRCAAAGVEFLNIAGSVLSTVASAAAITNVGFAFSRLRSGLARHGRRPRHVSSARRSRRPGTSLSQRRRTTAFGRSRRAPSRSRRPRISRAIGSACRSRRSSRRCSSHSAPIRPRSTSTNSTRRCRRISSTARRTASSPSRPASSTRCRNTSRETNHIWDPFWLIGNRRAFNPAGEYPSDRPDANSIAPPIEQRADSANLDTSLKDELIKKGLTFEAADQARVPRGALTKAGFYKEWRDKFGAETWAALEAVVGAAVMTRGEHGHGRLTVDAACARSFHGRAVQGGAMAALAGRGPGAIWSWSPKSSSCSSESSRARYSTSRSCGRTNSPPSCSSGWRCSARR